MLRLSAKCPGRKKLRISDVEYFFPKNYIDLLTHRFVARAKIQEKIDYEMERRDTFRAYSTKGGSRSKYGKKKGEAELIDLEVKRK